MKATNLIAAAVLGVSVFSARADVSTYYALSAGSIITEELVCLPPCTCEYSKTAGPLMGTFTLTRVISGPVWDQYSLTKVDLTAKIDGQAMVLQGTGTYTIGGDMVVLHQLVLDLIVGGVPQRYDSGMLVKDMRFPFPQIVLDTPAEVGCGVTTLTIVSAPGASSCYANCDASSLPPVLNVNDFTCFLDKFAAGDPYANCDGSKAEPTLNVNDFVCFLNTFAAGCK